MEEELTSELQKYMQTHDLETLVKELLSLVLKVRPSNPTRYLADVLLDMDVAKSQRTSFDLIQFIQDRYHDGVHNNQAERNLFTGFSMEGADDCFKPRRKSISMDFDGDAADEGRDQFDMDDKAALEISDKFHKMRSQNLTISRMRRGSVSAESVRPTEDTAAHVVVPKAEEAKIRIANAIRDNLLFRNLDVDQRNEIVDAMFEKSVNTNDAVIVQGQEGDNFYVVDKGQFDVIVNGKKVVSVGPGGSFGELALMYNTPRAATVIATASSVLWAVDRCTFRRIITNNVFRKRKLYESFLRTVPILQPLDPTEISRIADVLEPVEFAPGQEIVRQGDEGNTFFIIVDGEAVVTKCRDTSCDPQEVLRYSKGGYFGELALMNNTPRAATVTAASPVKCVSLDRSAFIRLLGPIMDILKRNSDTYQQYEAMLSTQH